MALLQPVADRVGILKAVTNYTDPILRLSYTPSPPNFTVRTILALFTSEMGSSPSHPFSATIFQPPTLEERARRMHIREQRALLWRLLFAVIVAIPTFIIGVVYMSLVGHSDLTRMWWMRPLWAGNASRLQWAMFFLATPVMFYSAGIFHRRSLKEIWALWKPKSRVPVWQRFVRFGSMNLLVSTGVSVAYFSSIALLALAASQAPSLSGEGDSTTYFDSVVFLSMFLLAGEPKVFIGVFRLPHAAYRSILGSLQQEPHRRCNHCPWEAPSIYGFAANSNNLGEKLLVTGPHSQ